MFAEKVAKDCSGLGDLGGLLLPSPKSTLLFQAGVSVSLTPVTWSRFQVRGPTMATTLTPSQMATHVDLSLDTLRYYKRAGFMPRVQRLPNGHRRYGESDIEWLELVKCLREKGIPVRHIQRCAELSFTGDEAIPERVLLLHEHRTNVVARTAELQSNLEHLDWKLAYHADTFGVTAGEATP
ncbi:MAG: MerR family transcriptional regulator [Acidimicrobiia bacterium]|nr:MerR family transcriptional regulator [Acidimicrobiia bacterium]